MVITGLVTYGRDIACIWDGDNITNKIRKAGGIIMRTLSIDIETYSSADLAKCGVYAYTQSEDFEILLFGYTLDGGEVRVVDLKRGEALPGEVMEALVDPEVLKTAFNANFERVCINTWFKFNIPPEQWSCTEVMALSLGLPSSLDGVGKILGIEEGKMSQGGGLVRYFSIPCKSNGLVARHLPQDDLCRWEEFKAYCKRDVEVEINIRKQLEKYAREVPLERRLWCLDQRINDRGVMVDEKLIECAISMDSRVRAELVREAMDYTGLNNPNSPAQLKRWFEEIGGINVEGLSKDIIDGLIKKTNNPVVKRVLEIRKELSKTSIRKYEAMKNALGSDGRIRGLFQFYGANRTGRWAGRLVQVQNLPRIAIENVDGARKLLLSDDRYMLKKLFGSVPEVLSQLIRTAFIPREGFRFIVSDFSAIEARIIAWLAGEEWRMEVFRTHGKIYEASAARMFNVPMESIDKGSRLRQMGKVAELALGYQGSVAALAAVGALNMGLSEEDLKKLVRVWRENNKHIVRFWKDVEKAAISTVSTGFPSKVSHGIEFFRDSHILFVRLPSGRCLSYINPRIEMDEVYGNPVLSYKGIEQGTKKWGRIRTYGGKLVENIVQATARDCLGEAMLRLEAAGYQIVMHVHDEVVLEVPFGFGSANEVKRIMETPILWAEGLDLRVEVLEGEYYSK